MSVHSWKIVESGGFYLGSRTHIHFLSITFLSYMSESVKTYPIFLSVTKTSVFRLMMTLNHIVNNNGPFGHISWWLLP